MSSNPADLPDRPVLTAADLLAHRRRMGTAPAGPAPEAVVLCYQRHLIDHVRRGHAVRALPGFLGDLLMLKRTGGRVALAGNFGIGAPVTAVLVEDLAAYGVQRFFAIGLAGALQPDLQTGDLVICERAIRAEGVSAHYLAASKDVQADAELSRGIRERLERQGQACVCGTSWTTDAPYRELQADVERHRQEGVKTVEMEAAALFAVAQALDRPAGAAFAIADTLSGGQWRMADDLRRAKRGLEILFEAALECLLE